jgi:hypothetical protein
MFANDTGTDKRIISNCVFDQTFMPSGAAGYQLENLLFEDGKFNPTGGTGSLATNTATKMGNWALIMKNGGVKNVVFANHTDGPSNTDSAFKNFYVGNWNNNHTVSDHEGVIRGQINFDTIVAEHYLKFSEQFASPALFTHEIDVDGEQHTTKSNVLIAYSGYGEQSFGGIQHKSNTFIEVLLQNWTFIHSHDNTSIPSGLLWSGHGADGCGWYKEYGFRDVLIVTVGTPSNSPVYSMSSSIISGVAQSGSSATVVDFTGISTTPTGDQNPVEAYYVKITSGDADDEIQKVVSNTSTSMTVSPAFSVDVTGANFVAFPLDQATIDPDGSTDYNACYGCQASGTIRDDNYDVYTTTNRIYDGLISSDPSEIGEHDLNLDSLPGFVSPDNSLMTWPTWGLGVAYADLWQTSTTYYVGDVVSKQVTGYYAKNTGTPARINYVCIQEHTSAALEVDSMLDGADGSWTAHWEPQGLTLLRQNILQKSGYLETATIANLIAFVRSGYVPTLELLRTSGYNNSYIGAVPLSESASNEIKGGLFF